MPKTHPAQAAKRGLLSAPLTIARAMSNTIDFEALHVDICRQAPPAVAAVLACEDQRNSSGLTLDEIIEGDFWYSQLTHALHLPSPNIQKLPHMNKVSGQRFWRTFQPPLPWAVLSVGSFDQEFAQNYHTSLRQRVIDYHSVPFPPLLAAVLLRSATHSSHTWNVIDCGSGPATVIGPRLSGVAGVRGHHAINVSTADPNGARYQALFRAIAELASRQGCRCRVP